MEEKDGVPTQWVVASLNAFYHFLIFVDLSAFMFSKQKTDLEPSAFISLWECRQMLKKTRRQGVLVREVEEMDSHTPEMYQILNVC